MKKLNLLSVVFLIGLSIFQFGCQEEAEAPNNDANILPERFGVDIPNSLSNTYGSNARITEIDTLKGNDIYGHLNNFIYIGEEAAEIVGEILFSIRIHNINKPMTLSFESDDDSRVKNMMVEEDATFDGEIWEFVLTITDAASESNLDGGKGLQIFWNRSPIRGVALLKPNNIDKEDHEGFENAMFRIDYSESGDHGYDSHMIVTITDLPVHSPLEDPFSVDNLKMFAGVKGDVTDVYGNSNHPNATLFSGMTGYNWAFAASSSISADIAVAEVGLPPSSTDKSSREELLEEYSINNVFTSEIKAVWPMIDDKSIEAFLYNTGAPGYFNKDGFVAGGEMPATDYQSLKDRAGFLTPYNPKEISEMELRFE